jgi:hypothetical protein
MEPKTEIESFTHYWNEEIKYFKQKTLIFKEIKKKEIKEKKELEIKKELK